MTLEGGNAVKGTGLAGAIGRARRKAYPDRYVPKNDPLVNPESDAIIKYLVSEGLDDKRVKVDSGDLYPGYLETKIYAGDGTITDKVEVGGVKKVRVTSKGQVKVSSDDTSIDYVENKIVGSRDIDVNVLNSGASETLEIEANGYLNNITLSPTGFEEDQRLNYCTISVVEATRTLTIAPLSTSFRFFIKGVDFVKTSAQSVVFPDVEGMHYFYFDSTGTLVTTQDFSAWVEAYSGSAALVSFLMWDADNNESIVVADDRHAFMDGSTHRELHLALGMQWVSGGSFSGIVADGNGSSNTHAQLGVNDVVVLDEDIRFSHEDGSPQELSPIAQIPVLYRSGADGNWRKKTADTFPLIYSGTASYTGASGRAPYNQYTGTVWQLTEVGNGKFFCIHIFATSNIEDPIIAVQGQAEYGSANEAQDGATTELGALLLGDLPLPELKALGTVLFQSSTGYSNTPHSIIVSINGGDYIDWRSSGRSSTGSVVSGDLAAHIADISNPHSVTKAQVGLTNVTDDAQLKRSAGDFAVFTSKATLVSGDIILVEDSAAANAKKKSTVGGIPHGVLQNIGSNTHAQIDSHISSTSNPHSVTKTQVGLTNVTDDAQLKRAAGDIYSFTDKGTPVSGDYLLIEDSADSNNKKRITIGSLPVVGVTRSGTTADNSITRWNGASADSIQGSTPTISDTGAIEEVLNASFGTGGNNASYSSGTVTVNWATGCPIQTATITGNVTAFSMTNPLGKTSVCLELTSSGGDYTIAGFTGVYWFSDDPDVDTVTIPNGSRAMISLIYKGSSTWSGSVVVK